MGDAVVARLGEHDHPFEVVHLSYEGVGHLMVRPYQPTTELAQPPGFALPLGGNARDAAHASEDRWGKTLTFLRRNLSTSGPRCQPRYLWLSCTHQEAP